MTQSNQANSDENAGFLGIRNIPSAAQSIINRYIILIVMFSFIGPLTDTFFILHIIDTLGFAYAGIITSLSALIQLITDYPSGSLSDWIGQRTVLTIAFLCFMAGNFILATSIELTSFIIMAILFGLGQGQASGTIDTWLDNNYKIAVGEADPDKKIYGFCISRIDKTCGLINAASFITGGFLATTFSRQFAFFAQAFLNIPAIMMIIILVVNIKTPEEEQKPKKRSSPKEYIKILYGGVRFLFSSKTAFFFLMGTAILIASIQLWGNLFLFPIYFGYTGSDALASLLRTTIYLIGVPIGLYMAKVSRKIHTKKIQYLYFPAILLIFPAFMILTTFIPLTSTLNLLGIICTIIILTITVRFILDVADTLRGRTMVDFVPSEYRNSIYSLIPTLFNIIIIPLLPITGIITENQGVPTGLTMPLITGLIGAAFIALSIHYKKQATHSKPQE